LSKFVSTAATFIQLNKYGQKSNYYSIRLFHLNTFLSLSFTDRAFIHIYLMLHVNISPLLSLIMKNVVVWLVINFMPYWPADCNDYLWIPQIQCCAVFIKGMHLKLLTLREKHRLRVFENRVLRRRFGPRREEVTG
jgi:uncharacterized protein (DUF2236 family)